MGKKSRLYITKMALDEHKKVRKNPGGLNLIGAS
jgi:hypothetical protein